jgi:hypothetical protein
MSAEPSTRPFTVIAAAAIVFGAMSLPAGLPMAAAAPPGFPDVNAFSPVDPNSHTVGNPRSTIIGFRTPGGVVCTWGFSTDPNDHDAVECGGNVPGIPDSAPDGGSSGCAQVKVADYPAQRSGPYVIYKHGGPCPSSFSNLILPLNAGQKLTATNITCVVGAGDLTACIDSSDGHGFVLQPSGSSGF